MRPFTDPTVAHVFAAYPPAVRRRLLALRALVFATARTTAGVGTISETLKWGEPAYRTAATGRGTTIRLGWKPRQPTQYALYVHCQTDLIARFRRRFPATFTFAGTRAIVFDLATPPPRHPLACCIADALTYHARPRAPAP